MSEILHQLMDGIWIKRRRWFIRADEVWIAARIQNRRIVPQIEPCRPLLLQCVDEGLGAIRTGRDGVSQHTRVALVRVCRRHDVTRRRHEHIACCDCRPKRCAIQDDLFAANCCKLGLLLEILPVDCRLSNDE